jgi:hypothetical protein
MMGETMKNYAVLNLATAEMEMFETMPECKRYIWDLVDANSNLDMSGIAILDCKQMRVMSVTQTMQKA